MSKGIYVGVSQSASTTTDSLNVSNLSSAFDVTNGSSYYYIWAPSNDSGGGVKFTPGNIGVNNSTATTILTATKALTNVVITGAYYTESNRDKITLTVAGTTVLSAVSGTSAAAQRWSGSLSSGQTIVLTYTKDTSQSASNESSTYFTVSCNMTVNVPAISNKAKKVKKIYVGVSNKAHKVKKAILELMVLQKNFSVENSVIMGQQQHCPLQDIILLQPR